MINRFDTPCMNGHAIHSWKKLIAKRGGKATFFNFELTLIANKSSFVVILRLPGQVQDLRITILHCISPGPKPFTKSTAYRVDKFWVRMVRQECLKPVDID